MKDKKISQPASRRVRDAAESLLCSLMEQVDFYTVHCGAESLSSTIGKSKVSFQISTLEGGWLPKSHECVFPW